MRLLLLLSALLGALTGVAGGRVAAQPVAASFSATVSVARVATVRAMPVGVPVAVLSTRPPAVIALPLVPAVLARILYAERRRE